MCFLELLWYLIWLLITTPSSFLILLLVYMFHYLAIVFFLSSNCIRSFLFFLSNRLFRQRDKYWSTVYMLFHSSEIQFFWCSIHKYSYKHVSNKYIKEMWFKDLAEKALSKKIKYSLYVLTIFKHFLRNWQVINWYTLRPIYAGKSSTVLYSVKDLL